MGIAPEGKSDCLMELASATGLPATSAVTPLT